MDKLNWHAIIIVSVLVIVPTAGTIMHLDPSVIGYVTMGVIALATASGFLHAQDEALVKDMASKLTIQTNSAISTVEQNLTALHAVSTANVAQIAQTVAVHSALIQAPAPAQLITNPPIVADAQVQPVKPEPHLVS